MGQPIKTILAYPSDRNHWNLARRFLATLTEIFDKIYVSKVIPWGWSLYFMVELFQKKANDKLEYSYGVFGA